MEVEVVEVAVEAGAAGLRVVLLCYVGGYVCVEEMWGDIRKI